MTIVGLILLIIGLIVAGLLFTGNAPAFLAALPIPFWGWCVVAVGGAVLMYLNRRPGD